MKRSLLTAQLASVEYDLGTTVSRTGRLPATAKRRNLTRPNQAKSFERAEWPSGSSPQNCAVSGGPPVPRNDLHDAYCLWKNCRRDFVGRRLLRSRRPVEPRLSATAGAPSVGSLSSVTTVDPASAVTQLGLVAARPVTGGRRHAGARAVQGWSRA